MFWSLQFNMTRFIRLDTMGSVPFVVPFQLATILACVAKYQTCTEILFPRKRLCVKITCCVLILSIVQDLISAKTPCVSLYQQLSVW